jgi:hypothetical protein
MAGPDALIFSRGNPETKAEIEMMTVTIDKPTATQSATSQA